MSLKIKEKIALNTFLVIVCIGCYLIGRNHGYSSARIETDTELLQMGVKQYHPKLGHIEYKDSTRIIKNVD